jgi:hypothetical protein
MANHTGIGASLSGWKDCWPKDGGENFVNTLRRKY